MADKNSSSRSDSIRGLIQDVAERSDALSNRLRQKTVFAQTRPADAKTFMLISRRPRGLTELAKALGISRQAAHTSIQRLIAIGVVSFDYSEGSKRDMIARLTDAGYAAQTIGRGIGRDIDAMIEATIGKDDLEILRRILGVLARTDWDTPD